MQVTSTQHNLSYKKTSTKHSNIIPPSNKKQTISQSTFKKHDINNNNKNINISNEQTHQNNTNSYPQRRPGSSPHSACVHVAPGNASENPVGFLGFPKIFELFFSLRFCNCSKVFQFVQGFLRFSFLFFFEFFVCCALRSLSGNRWWVEK